MGYLIRLLLFVFVVYCVWRVGSQIAGDILGGAAKRRRGQPAARIQDMAECTVCRTYMPADAPRCARADCPRRG